MKKETIKSNFDNDNNLEKNADSIYDPARLSTLLRRDNYCEKLIDLMLKYSKDKVLDSLSISMILRRQKFKNLKEYINEQPSKNK